MAGIGLYLKQVREQQGYTLEEMNRITNIHTKYLDALEQDQFDQLPSPFYAKAFLRTYAKSLGMDAQPLLELFDRTVLQAQKPKPSAPTVSETQQTPNLTYKPAPKQAPVREPFAKNPYDSYEYESSSSPFLEEHGDVRENELARDPYSPPASHQRPLSHGYQQVPNSSLLSLPPTPQSEPEQPEPFAQATQRMPVVSQPPKPSPSITSSFPKLDPPTKTFAPRRVSLEKKMGEGTEHGEKRKKVPGLTIAIAVGALLLIGSGAYYYFAGDTPAEPSNGTEVTAPEDGSNVNAGEVNMPFLEQGEISENPYEGQLFLIHNVDKLEVVLKANNGESTVLYAPTVNDQPKELTLKVGQVETLDTAGKNEIWFRLGTPSNVEVTVNGQKIITEAQDTEKSYRVQLKK